jgi:uncharacterized protein YqjF (DUF2071 family)
MLNYEIDPSVVQSLVPAGTELDAFAGKTYVSLVGLRFANTKLFGSIPVPFHSNFDEVNLRIYVRRNEAGEVRRGVVFIREIVPLPAVTLVARAVYGENYISLPMRHSIALGATGGSVEYQWKSKRQWFRMYAEATGSPSRTREGSLEQFISEHFWGYTRRRDGSALEYHVSHDPWHVWPAINATFEGDGDVFYRSEFGRVLARPPDSAFIADGSQVLVYKGTVIS